MKNQKKNTDKGILPNKKFKGFRVVVGVKKGNGFYSYTRTKAQAKAIGKGYKKIFINSAFKQQQILVEIKPIMLKMCDMCNNLCESDEKYCLKCEDLFFDARQEQDELYVREK